MGAAPRSGDLSPDQQAAGPYPRRPQRRTVPGVWDQQVAIGALQQEISIPAGQQPHRCDGPGGGPEGCFVPGQDPPLPGRCRGRGQRIAQGTEGRRPRLAADPRPLAEGLRRGRPVDVQIPAGEFQARGMRISLRRRYGPDHRLARAVPPDPDRAGRGRVPQPVGGHAERAARLPVSHPGAAEHGVQAAGDVLRPVPALRVIGQRPEGEDGHVPGGDHKDAVPRPPQLNQRGVLPGAGIGSRHARMDGQQRGAGHAVLQPGPGGPPQGIRPAGTADVQAAGVAPEGQDLGAGQVKPGVGHVGKSPPAPSMPKGPA